MIEKYFLWVEGNERPIGMKYDYRKGRGSVGGYATSLPVIRDVVKDYIGSDGDLSMPKVNRVRVDFHCTRICWETAVKAMKEHGLALKQVTNMERIMR